MGKFCVNLHIDYNGHNSESVKIIEKMESSGFEPGSAEMMKLMSEEEGAAMVRFENRVIEALRPNFFDLPIIIVALRSLAAALEGVIENLEDKEFSAGMMEKLRSLEETMDIMTIRKKAPARD